LHRARGSGTLAGMTRIRLDAVFASILLAACGACAPRVITDSICTARPASPPTPDPSQVESEDPSASRPVVARRAPSVSGASLIEPGQTLRPELYGSVEPSKLPDLAARKKKMEPLPERAFKLYPAVIRGEVEHRRWELAQDRTEDSPSGLAEDRTEPERAALEAVASIPPPEEPQTEEERNRVLYVWKVGGAWWYGTLAEALYPIDTPSKLLTYLELEGGHPLTVWSDDGHGRNTAAWHLVDRCDHYEVLLSVYKQFGGCGGPQMADGAKLVAVGRNGSISEMGMDIDVSGYRDEGCVGRDTEGSLRRASAPVLPRSPAAYFARLARDEATSVGSFHRLAAELLVAGAPAELVARAEAAAEDEVRHAQAMRALARAAGATEAELAIALLPEVAYPVRQLEAVLVENAREGCVNETYAALVALHQARHATDPRVREVFTEIAADEQRHAELAWDLHAWACAQDPRLAVRLRGALDDALADLARLIDARTARPWGAAVGEPDPVRARALVHGLGAALDSSRMPSA
jgi:hypothetical protein